MTLLIDRIIDILGRHGGRPTAEDLARLLRERDAWDFAGADPVASVQSALTTEREAAEPRVVRFFDAYSLRGPARRHRGESRPEPEPAAHAPAPRRDPEPDPADASARQELTGEGPRLLLDLLQGPRLVDHLDGRTVAALVRNDCAIVQNRWVSATPAARAVMRRHLLALGRSSRGRAAALFPAISGLVDSIPAGSEIPLASGPTAAADVLIALYDAALATDRRTPADAPDARTA